MKKLTILIWLLVVSLTPVHVMAASNATDGTVLGAIGGAAMGQAIGRDTEATLIGAALGSIFGYMIGNENDKSVHRVTRVITPTYDNRVYPQDIYPEDSYYEEGTCRDTEILAEIDGRPERVNATACYINGRWEIVDSTYMSTVRPTSLIIRSTFIGRPYHRHAKWHKRHYPRHHKRHYYGPARYYKRKHHNDHWYRDHKKYKKSDRKQYRKHTSRYDHKIDKRYNKRKDKRYERNERW